MTFVQTRPQYSWFIDTLHFCFSSSLSESFADLRLERRTRAFSINVEIIHSPTPRMRKAAQPSMALTKAIPEEKATCQMFRTQGKRKGRERGSEVGGDGKANLYYTSPVSRCCDVHFTYVSSGV